MQTISTQAPDATLKAINRARAFIEYMAEKGRIEVVDEDTYRITDKGRTLAAQHRERA